MPTNLQIRRGLQSALPTGLAGEPLFTTDTKRLYISDGTATNLLQGASSLLTTGAIPFSDANGKLTMNASSFYWDATNNRLGIGTASPAAPLTVQSNSGALGISIRQRTGNDFANLLFTNLTDTTLGGVGYVSTSRMRFMTGGLGDAFERLSVFQSTGNVTIGTTTDAGYKLDVNGTTRTSRIDSLTNQSFSIQYQGSGNQTGNLGDNTAQIRLINNLATTSTTGTNHFLSILPSFTPTSGTTIWNATLITPTINQTGGANGITRGLYIQPTLTAAADFRAIEVASGTTVLAPSVTARASLRIPSGTAPTSPVNGDIWFDGTNIKMQIGGVTKTFTLL